jgi:hypothetical protein
MPFDLPWVNPRILDATKKLRPTEAELDPWGATTVPRAPRMWEPDIATQPAASPDITTMRGRIEASRIYGAPEPGSMAAELGLQTRPYPESIDRPLPDVSTYPYIPLTESGLAMTLPGEPAVRPARPEQTYDPGGVFGDITSEHGE